MSVFTETIQARVTEAHRLADEAREADDIYGADLWEAELDELLRTAVDHGIEAEEA